MPPIIQTKRVYTDPDGSPETDGYRIFVDRLWPRGESKAKFHYDLWEKSIAPSDELRHWFHENPEERAEEFRSRYETELAANPATGELIEKIRPMKLVTLLYSSRDETMNNAVVLADYLRKHL